MKFTPQANITVDALAFYKGANTLTAGESVGIFNSSGGLVTSTFVSLSDTLQDGYLWHAISSVVLNAGQQYTVVAYTGANPWSYGGVPMVNSSISYGGQTYHYGGGLTFPTQTVGHAADGYYGPNFSIAAVPEPSTVIAGALLLLPCGLALRQFLKKANAA